MKNILKIIENTTNRFDFWSQFLRINTLKTVAELGVYKGDFASYLLSNNNSIEKYYMLDPWRNLNDWNKPANTNDNQFQEFYSETMSKTNFAAEKRVVLRGKTTEVINKIEDNSLDFLYIDGDHTLKGITIDLIASWNKIKDDGFIAGDDFCASIWQHNYNFEPTLIFPFAIYFAEAMNVKIYALPFNQFLINKKEKGFEFVNLSNEDYKNVTMLKHIKNIGDIEKPNHAKRFKVVRNFFRK